MSTVKELRSILARNALPANPPSRKSYQAIMNFGVAIRA